MRIIIFPASYYPILGGIQEVVFRLSKEFKKRGHKVTIITQRYPRKLEKKEILEDILVYRILFPNLYSSLFELMVVIKYLLGIFLVPFSFLKLLSLLRREKPDLVHLHFVGTGALYLLCCRPFIPFKMIVTLHGDDVEGLPFRHQFHKWLLSKTLRNADFVTSCSNYLLLKARTLCPVIEGKSIAIHNGIDLADFDQKNSYKHVRPYIFAAGRFVYKKGFDILIKAFTRILTKGYNIDLILAGEGEELSNYIMLADSLHIQWSFDVPDSKEKTRGLIFWGRANGNEMKSLLSGSKIFVVPSRREPFGIVILEAMAAGTPVIATNVGGIPEIITTDTGMFVPKENDIELSNAIEILLNKKNLRDELIKKGKKRAEEFSWEVIAQTYLGVVDSNFRT